MHFAMGSAQGIGNVSYLGRLVEFRGTSGLDLKPAIYSHYSRKACGSNTITRAGLQISAVEVLR
jgi:hypothetical protein